jgi:hypothetical protein
MGLSKQNFEKKSVLEENQIGVKVRGFDCMAQYGICTSFRRSF